VLNNNLDAINALIKAGADVDGGVKHGGHTPLAFAARKGYKDAADILIKAGAHKDTGGRDYNYYMNFSHKHGKSYFDYKSEKYDKKSKKSSKTKIRFL
jgi:ankyrin repeat protein